MTDAQEVDLPDLGVGPHEIMVVVEKGSEADVSPRLASALEELSAALAEEETSEVEGFAFEPALQMGSALDTSGGPSQIYIGCMRVGCFRGCEGKVACSPRSCKGYAPGTESFKF